MHLKYTEENKMPSKSKKQHNLMEAVAHNKAFAKKVGIPQSVGKDFSEADKGRSFKQGGVNMKKKSVNPAMAMMRGRAMKRQALAFRPEAPVMTRPAAPVMPTVNPMAAMSAGAQGMPMMKKGGKAKGCATKSDAKMIAKKEVKGHESSMHKMKSGGYASGGKASQLSKANGIAVRGKTKGKMC